jgi:hypothetical protein
MNEEELRTHLGSFVRIHLTNGEMLQGKLLDLTETKPGLYRVQPDPPHCGISSTPPEIDAESVAIIEVLGRV